MRITTLYSNSNYNNCFKRDRYLSDSIKSTNTCLVSFTSTKSNSELIRSGYKIAQISNNKIANNHDAIIIDSSSKLKALCNSPEMWKKKIVLSRDIDLGGAEIKPIGNNLRAFKGKFDGNGYTIKNFKINLPQNRNVGLFGKCENAEIKNLSVEDATIVGMHQIGGLVGYATDSEISDIDFSGYIKGEKKIGGLIGYSENNKIKNVITSGIIKSETIQTDEPALFGYNPTTFDTLGVCGGIIGTDLKSTLEEVSSSSTLLSDSQVGGLIGYSEYSGIKNSFFDGILSGSEKVGSIIGWGNHSEISNGYANSKSYDLIGEKINCNLQSVYDDISDLVRNAPQQWDSKVWLLERGRLPRLIKQLNKIPVEKIFIEDINTDIKIGKISVPKMPDNVVVYPVKIKLQPPKHYPENDKILDEISNCKNTDWLRYTFGVYAMKELSATRYDKSAGFNDEVLLELIKNPYMDLNKRLTGNDGGYYNVACTPLFILTCLNKAYILKEALKRDDANYECTSGFDDKLTILYQATRHHIDDSLYAMMTVPKMRDYILANKERMMSYNLSKLATVLYTIFPNVPEYHADTESIHFQEIIEIPKDLMFSLQEVQTLKDVQRTYEISPDYLDTNKNNILNIASNITDPSESLPVLLSAIQLKTDLNNINIKGESPLGHAIYKNNTHFVFQLIDKVDNPFIRLGDGTDAMLLFSKMPEESYSINYMDEARKQGFNVNSTDSEGNTPLINALKLGHHKKMKYLLMHGASPDMPDKSGQTPLHHACINNDTEAIDILLGYSAYPSFKDILGLTPFEYLTNPDPALKKRFEDLTYLYTSSDLTHKEFDPITQENENVFCEIDSGDINHLTYITDTVTSDTDWGERDRVIQRLTRNLMRNPSRMLDMKDKYGNNILHIASSTPSMYAKECIKAALDQGVLINSCNNNNETPLMCALNSFLASDSLYSKLAILQNIRAILESEQAKNLNIDMVDINKQSVLHKVCQSGNGMLFNMFLALNPKINQIDNLGHSPFEYIMSNDANDPMNIIARQYLTQTRIVKEQK